MVQEEPLAPVAGLAGAKGGLEGGGGEGAQASGSSTSRGRRLPCYKVGGGAAEEVARSRQPRGGWVAAKAGWRGGQQAQQVVVQGGIMN